MHPVPFYGYDYEKLMGPETSYQSLLELQNMFRKIPFLVIYNLGNFDDLIQSGFWVIPKITFAKIIHGAIIIPVSYDSLNLETAAKKGKNYKKFIISRTKRAFLMK